MAGLFEKLEKDLRFIEGLKACLNCGDMHLREPKQPLFIKCM
jgi:hypothetical protein